jgi:hypothetical protein
MMAQYDSICPECGEEFNNVFEATDHLLEEDEEFDPALILPNGYRLMIGSLLRCLYNHADSPEMIEDVVQSTYATLFAAESKPEVLGSVIEDIIVGSSMNGLDDELKKLLEDGK